LKSHLLSKKRDEALDDELMELKIGEQAFMATRPKLIQAGYITLDSIPRLKTRSRTRFYCPALKGVDGTTQNKVSKWIQLLHKHPAHLHALGIKDAQPQRDPGIQPLAGMTITKLTTNISQKETRYETKPPSFADRQNRGLPFFVTK